MSCVYLNLQRVLALKFKGGARRCVPVLRLNGMFSVFLNLQRGYWSTSAILLLLAHNNRCTVFVLLLFCGCTMVFVHVVGLWQLAVPVTMLSRTNSIDDQVMQPARKAHITHSTHLEPSDHTCRSTTSQLKCFFCIWVRCDVGLASTLRSPSYMAAYPRWNVATSRMRFGEALSVPWL